VPFIRRTRDKRGYETTYVMHAYRPSQGPHRTRILYVFRSPAGSRIGREALEGEVQEALEHTHPDLTFDWQALLRESMEPPRRPPGRGDAPERPARSSRSSNAARSRADDRAQERAPAPEQAPPVVTEDTSILGLTLGAGTAARLRARYAELLQRIARRSRSPEERDRLVEHARRLNPDDWADEAAVRAAVVTVDAEWQAIVETLPARRRGRRGGRRRGHGRSPAEVAPPASEGHEGRASVIIEDAGNTHELDDHERANRPDSVDDAARDGDGVGAEPADPAATAGPEKPSGDVPDDD
jgi:hypothetical protein